MSSEDVLVPTSIALKHFLNGRLFTGPYLLVAPESTYNRHSTQRVNPAGARWICPMRTRHLVVIVTCVHNRHPRISSPQGNRRMAPSQASNDPLRPLSLVCHLLVWPVQYTVYTWPGHFHTDFPKNILYRTLGRGLPKLWLRVGGSGKSLGQHPLSHWTLHSGCNQTIRLNSSLRLQSNHWLSLR